MACCTGWPGRTTPVLAWLVDEGIPVVLFNRGAESREISAVLPDDRTGTRSGRGAPVLAWSSQHRARRAGRRTSRPPSIGSGRSRRRSRTAGLSGSHGFAHRHTEEEGYRVTSDLLEERPDTTAVLAANDRLALGAIDAIREVGRSCPEDVSVVGFNDMPYSDRFSPPLTTVHISQNEPGLDGGESPAGDHCGSGAARRDPSCHAGAGGAGARRRLPRTDSPSVWGLVSEQPFVQSPDGQDRRRNLEAASTCFSPI